MARNKKTATPKINFTDGPKKAKKPVKEKKARKAKTTERDPLVRDLPCELDQDERDSMSWAATKLAEKRRATIRTMASGIQLLRAEIKNMAADEARLQHQAATGFEIRPVQCAEEIDGEEVKLVRSDTGEEVERRPITPAEATGNLFPSGEQKERADGFLTGGEA
jgi:hypothetical protein